MDKNSGIKIESNEHNNFHLYLAKDVLDFVLKIYNNDKILKNVERLLKKELTIAEEYECSFEGMSNKNYIDSSRIVIILKARQEELKKIIREDLIQLGYTFYETIVRLFPKNFL